MQKIPTGIILATLLLVLLPVDQADAGRRRCRTRQHCVPCVQYVAPYCSGSVATQCPTCPGSTSPSQTNAASPTSFFPDICPIIPQVYDAINQAWVWDAERHYGEGKNCSNCYIEMSTLTGDFDLYGDWPYPCGHAMCQPSTNVRQLAVPYSGQRANADTNPVNLDFDPISDMPRGIQAREISPRKYVSFTDVSDRRKVRYFIVYKIRVQRGDVSRETRFGHEVAEAELQSVQDQIRPLAPSQVVPLDRFGAPGDEHTNVYAYKNLDGENAYVLYLKAD